LLTPQGIAKIRTVTATFIKTDAVLFKTAMISMLKLPNPANLTWSGISNIQ
jgi:hypothetical protein